MRKAASVISIILGIALLVGMCFGIYVLLESTNYCKNWPTDFWVTIDGNRYYVDSHELVLSDTDIYVHYLIEWLSKKQGYTYKVVPAGNDFCYMVDGVVGNWLGIEDLTPAFEVVARENGLSIKAHGKTIADVLQALHPNKDIVTSMSEDGNYHFKLVVTSLEGKSVELTFRCLIVVESIELDPPSIVF